VLHLRREPEQQGSEPQEWAEFYHVPGRRFTDFSAVRDEITAETDRLLGTADKDVSDKPVHLIIHSPHVLCVSLRLKCFAFAENSDNISSRQGC
jgi:dynamin 1-like protein